MVKALCLLVICGSLLVCGCSSYNVKSLPYDSSLTSVVLVENPKVIVRDFVDVLQDEFNARNIKVILFSAALTSATPSAIVAFARHSLIT